MTDKSLHPPAADVPDDPSRRRFMQLVGASAAVASASLAGCIRKPVEMILPYSRRPEDLIPGRPVFFATSMHLGDAVLGLLVESQDGRPTKIEGNPHHPSSRGGTHAWAQATVMDLYDEDRSRTPRVHGREVTAAAMDALLDGLATRLAERRGEGLALLCEWVPSPTWFRLLAELRRRCPALRFYVHDLAWRRHAAAGAKLVGAGHLPPSHALEKADVILALDADFLHTEGDSVRHAREFAARREPGAMNRLYAVEPAFTVTGAMADHRLRLPASQVGPFLAALAARLRAHGVALPLDGDLRMPEVPLRGGAAPALATRWADEVARDLAAHKGRSAVIVGERQPPYVHALGHLINAALGNVGETVRLVDDPDAPDPGTIEELAGAIVAGEVQTLVMVGGNPVYDAPADLGFDVLVRQVPLSIHLSPTLDETSRLAHWHIPRSHFLECWGDLRAGDGTASLRQPLIAPLFDTRSELELAARLAGVAPPSAYGQLRAHWAASFADPAVDPNDDAAGFEAAWRRWLHDGVITGPPATHAVPQWRWDGLIQTLREAAAGAPAENGGGALEIAFQVDASVLDGRFANNPWMQELPDPWTKLTWDNAALLSPATAQRLGIATRLHDGRLEAEIVRLSVGGRSILIPALAAPGAADDVIVLPLGYGRTHGGRTAAGAGVDAFRLRTAAAPGFVAGAVLAHTDGCTLLASTQDHVRPEPLPGWKPRPHVREATLEQYRQEPGFVAKYEVLPAAAIKSLWEHPQPGKDLQQWGMTIDLNSCVGCNACTVACQAENNIPVVGKTEVLNGREMHWIRLDRYVTGDENDPRAQVQPMACVHCETAPCENVCPVAATAHSPDGMNDMAYNRCIGTRYCSNNCPYKVRRFNFFNYTRRNDEKLGELVAMQRNPDVTVRFRGVMEKCTYCVQRVNEARIAARREGQDVVADGAIVTACAQACPTRAIVFGDITDPNSAVSKKKSDPRNYAVLGELNVQPRTTYLARLRNPNPRLA